MYVVYHSDDVVGCLRVLYLSLFKITHTPSVTFVLPFFSFLLIISNPDDFPTVRSKPGRSTAPQFSRKQERIIVLGLALLSASDACFKLLGGHLVGLFDLPLYFYGVFPFVPPGSTTAVSVCSGSEM